MADMDPDPGMLAGKRWTISQLAVEFGVTTRALRFYEEEGLVSPLREGSVRRYSRRDRARLAWICRAKRLGFSLAEIREVIGLFESASTRDDARAALLAISRERMATLVRQRQEIDGMLAELGGFVAGIEALLP
jgi:DNA-binding transcriptional MerR regulator